MIAFKITEIFESTMTAPTNIAKDIFFREFGLATPLTFCRRRAAYRARNLALSRLRTIGITEEAEDAPNAANRNLLVHKSAITALDIESQEWRYLLAGAADGSIYIHDLANFSGIPRHNSSLIMEIKGNKGNADLHERTSGRLIGRRNPNVGPSSNISNSKKLQGHFKTVTSVQWFPQDSGMFITSGMDGSVKMWDANALESGPVEEFNFPHEQIFSHHLSVFESTTNSKKSSLTLVAVASESNHINLLDLKSGSASHELR